MTAKWLLLRVAGSAANRQTTAVMYLSGDLDETFRPMLAECLHQLASKRADRLVLDLSNVKHLDSWSAAAMLASASAVLPDGVHPVIRDPRPRAYRTLLRCRDVAPWDLELSDDARPAMARRGRVMAIS